MRCAVDNHNDMCNIYAKELLGSNFNIAVIYKISNFNGIAPNFTFSQKSYFQSITGTFETNPFFPINSMAGTCKGSIFSFLLVVNR